MDDFPFLLNLNYKMNDFEIKPPSNLFHLKEIATEKYDLKIAEMFYVTEEGEEIELQKEEDYLDMIQYATDNDLKQIEIIIKKNENISERRKESLRKKSSMKNEYENPGKSKKTKLSKKKMKLKMIMMRKLMKGIMLEDKGKKMMVNLECNVNMIISEILETEKG